jgi:DNA-directed RNA polymerase specialized sigma24 family protein
VPDDATLPDLIGCHQRRLYLFLRALLPAAAEAEAGLRESIFQLWDRAGGVRPERFADFADGVARKVAGGRRKESGHFSEDLFRQLADSAGPSLELVEKRPAVLSRLFDQLPPPDRDLLRRRYELGMTAEQIALSENRPVTAVNRDLAGLHASLVAAIRERLPDAGPEPPGGANDLGRLTGQLLDGTITDDGRLVLETLLLADAAAQAHYHRHVALVAELTLRFRGLPPLPERPVFPAPRVSRREQVVTWAFVAACTVVLLFLIFLFTGWLR